MLVLLRIVFGTALLYEMMEGAKSAPGTGEAGDLTGAAYLAVCLVLGILNALVWAPYLGIKVAGPLTGVFTGGEYVERTNWVMRLVRRCDARRWRRLTVALSFWEAVRHPSSPAPYVTGFRNARPGSWLEKVFAREVFRFNNTQNCVEAYLALKRHGLDPRPHRSQEVNIVLLSLERPPRREAEIVPVPSAAPPPPLQRNPRIRLFKTPGEDLTAAHAPEPAPGAPEIVLESSAAPGPPPGSAHPDAPPPAFEQSESGGAVTGLLARVAAFIRAH